MITVLSEKTGTVTGLSHVTSHPLSQCPDPTRPDPTHSYSYVSIHRHLLHRLGQRRMDAKCR